MKPARLVRDLPLFWKLLLPFLALMVLLGAIGAILVGRDLSSRAREALNEDLLRRSLAARSAVHDRELYILEGVDFAANLRGMSDVARERNRATAADLLRSVLALKKDLDLLVVTDAQGIGLAELGRQLIAEAGGGGRWAKEPFVASALRDTSGAKWSGLLEREDGAIMAVASPICSGERECRPVGAAIAGISMTRLAGEAVAVGSPGGGDTGGVVFFGPGGRALGASGLAISGAPPPPSTELIRRTSAIGSEEVAVLYAPMEFRSTRTGTIAVTTRTAPAFAAVRSSRNWLIPVLLAGLVGIIGIGSVLSRSILAQVRSLVATNRALGSGLLTARAPVIGRDELGELARGLNQMADQLQASVATLEMRVEHRTEEVQRLMRERSEFFAALSHELRTPLAVILAEAKMLHDPAYAKRGNWSSKAGRTIEDSAGQLLSLVNDILELAKAEAGHIDVKREKVNLPDVVRGARRTIEGLGRSAGLRVRVDVPADLPPVWADPARLREVIMNLVENAVKYTPSGGYVTLAAAAVNGHVEVDVSDTGVGIPAEVRQRIFEPFYRVEGVSSQRGEASTGLGLALTKRLVEAQGGTIDLTSEPGRGTTFRVTLRPAE